jgi:hypothetical protein
LDESVFNLHPLENLSNHAHHLSTKTSPLLISLISGSWHGEQALGRPISQAKKKEKGTPKKSDNFWAIQKALAEHHKNHNIDYQ